MAYDPAQQDPNQQQNQSATANPMTTSSAPGAGPGASTGKNAATPQSAPTQPFQNLQSYLTANTPQVNQQAQTISGNLNNQYGQVQSDINKATSEFGNQVKGGYAQNEDVLNQAASNPSSFVSNPENMKAFQSLYNDTYSGPTNFEGSEPYGSLSKEISSATQNASNFNSLPGMQTYFQNQNPNATKGGNILDSVLLQGNPEAVSQVQNAAKPFANLNDYLNTATTQANQGVTDAQKAASDISANAQNRFTGEVIPSFQNTINNQVIQNRTQAQQREDNAKAALELKNANDLNIIPGQEPKISDQTLSDLGLGRDQLESMIAQRDFINNTGTQSPIDLASYLGLTQQSPEAQINAANSASSNDYANAEALSKLTGQDLSSFLNQADISKANTANLNLNTINPDQIDALMKLYKSQQGLPTASKPGYIPPAPPPPPPTGGPTTIISTPGTVTGGSSGSTGIDYIDPATGETKKAF